jgi:hypothetical protein
VVCGISNGVIKQERGVKKKIIRTRRIGRRIEIRGNRAAML